MGGWLNNPVFNLSLEQWPIGGIGGRRGDSYMHNPESVLHSEIQTDHLISARRPDKMIVKKKKKRRDPVDSVIPADHRVKLKESAKWDKCLDLAREKKKKLWNVKMTVKSIVIGSLVQ